MNLHRTEKKIFDTLSKNLKRISNLNLTKHYIARSISSIYFDTDELFHFHRSEEGITPRSKFRVRNYNNQKIYSLEIKSKINENSNKKIIKLDKFNLSEIKKIIFKLSSERLYPKLKVSYKRKYYLSSEKKIRYTLDYDIKFYKLDKNCKILLSKKELNSVIEVKKNTQTYHSELEDLYGGDITRFSKYCEGIKKFY
tara:strand:- start:140 stop:730 length:591 start_codon:yes stop_codon:yes gene_type:complete